MDVPADQPTSGSDQTGLVDLSTDVSASQGAVQLVEHALLGYETKEELFDFFKYIERGTWDVFFYHRLDLHEEETQAAVKMLDEKTEEVCAAKAAMENNTAAGHVTEAFVAEMERFVKAAERSSNYMRLRDEEFEKAGAYYDALWEEVEALQKAQEEGDKAVEAAEEKEKEDAWAALLYTRKRYVFLRNAASQVIVDYERSSRGGQKSKPKGKLVRFFFPEDKQ